MGKIELTQEEYKNIKVHPLADKFPMMSNEEYQALKDSVKKDGLLMPIILTHDNVLIDGRNRLKACIEVNIPPRFITLRDFIRDYEYDADKCLFDVWNRKDGLNKALNDGDNEVVIEELIKMLNVNRRHLNNWQKYQSLSTVEKLDEQTQPVHTETAPGAVPKNLTIKETAAKINVSERTFYQMKYIDKNGDKTIKRDLDEDRISVKEAYNRIIQKEKEAELKNQARYSQYDPPKKKKKDEDKVLKYNDYILSIRRTIMDLINSIDDLHRLEKEVGMSNNTARHMLFESMGHLRSKLDQSMNEYKGVKNPNNPNS